MIMSGGEGVPPVLSWPCPEGYLLSCDGPVGGWGYQGVYAMARAAHILRSLRRIFSSKIHFKINIHLSNWSKMDFEKKLESSTRIEYVCIYTKSF